MKRQLPFASACGSTISFNFGIFLFENNFLEEILKRKENCHQCRTIHFLKISILKISVP
jgi:hypothetical protein